MDGISKDTYNDADQNTKNGMVFDVLLTIHNDVEALKKGFEDRKIKDRSFAGMMGFIGGFIGSFVKNIWK